MKKFIVLALTAILIVSLSVVFVSAEETNVAAGKSYTYTGANTNANTNEIDYPDTDNKELTDGTIGKEADFGYQSPIWVGLNPNGEGVENNLSKIVVDLGAVTEGITGFSLIAEDCGSGIFFPVDVEVFVSDDDKNYTSVGKATKEKIIDKATEEFPDYGIYKYSLAASEEQSAKFVKFAVQFREGGGWVFVSEVEVYTGGELGEPAEESKEVSEVSKDKEESKEVSQIKDDTSEKTDTSKTEKSEPADESEPEDDEEGLSTGAIVGIVAGAAVVIGLIIYFATRKKE